MQWWDKSSAYTPGMNHICTSFSSSLLRKILLHVQWLVSVPSANILQQYKNTYSCLTLIMLTAPCISLCMQQTEHLSMLEHQVQYRKLMSICSCLWRINNVKKENIQHKTKTLHLQRSNLFFFILREYKRFKAFNRCQTHKSDKSKMKTSGWQLHHVLGTFLQHTSMKWT